MEPRIHIAVVDDDAEIRDLLCRFLEQHELRVTAVADGGALFSLLPREKIDLIVLDLMLPGEDGLAITRRLRAESSLPIIMLTAMGEDVDRIVGLEMGVDDYMAKPFNPRELLARIRSVLRRAAEGPNSPLPGTDDALFTFDRFTLDRSAHSLLDNHGEKIDLTGGDYSLLTLFLDNAGQVLSRDRILDHLSGRDLDPFDRAVDVQVSRLRKKIERDPADPRLILTKRGEGYLFTAKPSPVKRGATDEP